MRFFNTAGPVRCAEHYCLPPLERFDLDNVLTLIAQKKYFVLHAPRQTGKTSSMLALMAHLNQSGAYTCLYSNVEVAQSARENVTAGVQAILGEMASRAATMLDDPFPQAQWAEVFQRYGAGTALNEVLTRWAAHSPRPLVILIDEIDALVGDTLIAVLRQMRAGYDKRPAFFPQSVILCGVRDVRDYRIHSAQTKDIITGGSAFNIKAESLRLGNFTPVEVAALLAQHTQETGQVFAPGVPEAVADLTGGQPWLVNALAYEMCFRAPAGRDRARSISLARVTEAKESLIARRETHLDQLVDKLREPRVHGVIAPILAGDVHPTQLPEDDVLYVRDLGLITTEGQLRIANPIYQEVIPRALTYTTQLTISQEAAWYLTPAGRLDMPQLLTAFQDFFRQHAEHWVERFDYKEAGPQLLLQAFLQRIVNGGGRIEREYGLGRLRTDLLLVWPVKNQESRIKNQEASIEYPASSIEYQKVVLELKLLHAARAAVIAEGVAQTWAYMDRCGATEGYLVLFDRDPDKPWAEKLFHREELYRDTRIGVWGM